MYTSILSGLSLTNRRRVSPSFVWSIAAGIELVVRNQLGGNITVFVTSGVGTSILPLRYGAQSQWDFLKLRTRQ